MPLYIAQSGHLDRCHLYLTDWLTHSLTTLKDRATQLLKKYKSGALVTQFNSFWQWEGFPLFSLPLILIHNWKKGKVTKYAVTLFRCLVTTLSNFIHNPQSARPLNTSNIKWEIFQSKCKALSQFWQHSSFVRVTFRWFHEASYQSMMMTMIVIWKRIKGGRRLGVKNSVAVDLLSCRFAKLNQDPREWESANGREKKSVLSK